MLNVMIRITVGLFLITGLSACPVGEDNEGGGIGNLGERDGDEGDDD